MIHNKVSPNAVGTSYSNGEIGLAGQPRPNVESTLLHEFQHQVQDIEGFAKGGSPTQFAMSPERMESVATYLDNLYNARWIMSEMKQSGRRTIRPSRQSAGRGPSLSRIRSGGHVRPVPMKHGLTRPLLKRVASEAAKNNGHDGYRRLAGEVEARNVQQRQDSIRRTD